jgi:acyl-CoA synthetase (AMP-forming)/AMP-acid ligase II
MSSVRLDRAALARDEAVPAPDGVEIARLGPPVPGFEIRVADPAGADLPPGRIGRIHVRGPSLLSGYLHQPEETAEVLHDGWLDTGDRGFLDGDELVVTGRDKEVLVLRGRKWPPHLVEQAVDGLAGLRVGCTAAVSHQPEDAPTEQLLLLAETAREASDRDVAALPAACATAVLAATGLALDEVVLLAPGTLPRTSSGKIRRREALVGWLAGTLAPPDRVTPLAVAGWYLRSAWAFARLPRAGVEP